MAIFFMDLDGFKQVNDTYGHAVGDALLQEVSKRLVINMRGSDTISRFGGDEFVLLLTEINQVKIVNEMADKIVKLFKEPFHISNNVEIRFTISMGIATYPIDAVDWEELLKKADVAMYSAKELGKNNY
jgi:diguanylate cyclase (GGDEF)-like protein